MAKATVRCPKCGHEGIVITDLLNSDLALISDSQQVEIERLTQERDELIETTAGALHHVGHDTLEQRFRTSKSPLHQRLSMVVHALAAEAAGDK